MNLDLDTVDDLIDDSGSYLLRLSRCVRWSNRWSSPGFLYDFILGKN